MAYNPNIPQSTDQLSVSQGQILQNFQALQTNLNKNHVDLNNALEGLHKYVQMPNISSNNITVPAIGADEMAIYSNTYGKTAQTEVFIRKQAGSTADPVTQQIPMTAARFNSTGYCYLPSGLLMIWATGATGNNSNGTYTISFPNSANIPVFTAVYNIQLTATWDGNDVDPYSAFYVGPVTTGAPGSFKLRLQARALGGAVQNTFSYVAIGIGA